VERCSSDAIGVLVIRKLNRGRDRDSMMSPSGLTGLNLVELIDMSLVGESDIEGHETRDDLLDLGRAGEESAGYSGIRLLVWAAVAIVAPSIAYRRSIPPSTFA
jgi:hypothetical protein